MTAEEISRELREARQRAEDRRTQEFHAALAKRVVAEAGEKVGPEALRAAALALYPHLHPGTRESIVERALAQASPRPLPASREAMSESNGSARLNEEQREEVRAHLRTLLRAQPEISPSAARRRIERELGILFTPTTFYSGYWQRVKLEVAAGGPAADPPSPELPPPAAANGDGREPPADGAGEHLTLVRDISGDYRVQLDVVLPRAEALRLMQAIVGSLPPEA